MYNGLMNILVVFDENMSNVWINKCISSLKDKEHKWMEHWLRNHYGLMGKTGNKC